MKKSGKGAAGAYRYGFNGKEEDSNSEWGGQSHYDYGFRIYNPSIAKFLSVDPLATNYPYFSPYQFAGNKPVMFIDLDGAEELPYWDRSEYNTTEGALSKGLRFSGNSLKSIYNDAAGTWNYGVQVTKTGIHEGPLSAAQKVKRDVTDIGLGIYNYTKNTSFEEFRQDIKKGLSSVETYEQAVGGLVTFGGGAALKANKLGNFSKIKNLTKETPLGLVPYDPHFAVKQGLNSAEATYDFDVIRRMIPDDVPNTFKPSSTILEGEKYKFSINNNKIELKWHSPDSDAATRFPGSNSGTTNTTQINVGKKFLNQSGQFQRKPDNSTHIPLKE